VFLRQASHDYLTLFCLSDQATERRPESERRPADEWSLDRYVEKVTRWDCTASRDSSRPSPG
jgi:hypothetical protein